MTNFSLRLGRDQVVFHWFWPCGAVKWFLFREWASRFSADTCASACLMVIRWATEDHTGSFQNEKCFVNAWGPSVSVSFSQSLFFVTCLRVCVCVYLCASVCIRVYVCMRVYVYVYVHMHVYVYVCISVCVYRYMCRCIYLCLYMFICMDMCMDMIMYMLMCM